MKAAWHPATSITRPITGCDTAPMSVPAAPVMPYRIATCSGGLISVMAVWMFDDQDFYKVFLRRIPIGRLGEPEDFIGAVLYLSSKASDFMTGAIMYVDGGYTAG